MRAYGIILDHVLIIIALYPFQHFSDTNRGERVVLIHYGISLQCLVPKSILAERIITQVSDLEFKPFEHTL